MKALDSRASKLLKDLIARYIEAGEPVPSGLLARECGLDLSPATVRNILVELEASGLIRSPHTSAGRVPTALGYRFYIDQLVRIEDPPATLVESIRARLPLDAEPDQVLRAASHALAELTGCAGLVSMPRREQMPLRLIDFVVLAPTRLLMILVFDDGQVQNRLLQSDRPFTAEQVHGIAQAINERYAGRCLDQIRESLLDELRAAKSELDGYTGRVVAAAENAFMQPLGGELLISGESRLVRHEEFADVVRLRRLFEAFEQRRELLELIERAGQADSVRLFIGEESGMEPFAPCALIAAPYRRHGRALGVLGVIGPTRLPYQRVIPVVRATAQAVESVLNLA